ncbi:MAG: hypothetical protein IIY77_09050 [Lachnospiraceae bacterium]|nr:hypothetical protein [Lachnospiraceae bacterium]
MMIERIQEALKELELQDYLISDTEEASAELFFVRKKLDMRRRKNTEKADVTVFRNGETEKGRMRGASEAGLTPDMDDEEIKAALREAYASAENAMNPWYELYQGTKGEKKDAAPEISLTDAAALMADALYAEDVRNDAFINSAEIFIEKRDVRIVSCTGTDVSYTAFSVNGEFVTQCLEPKDVEQHFTFRYDGLETEALKEKVREALNTVSDRAKAAKAPSAGTYDIVLSGENLAEILSFYTYRSNASLVYAGYSDYKTGMAVQSAGEGYEKLNLNLLSTVPYSSEGIPMKERELLKEGVLQTLHGTSRFCYYLGCEPTGDYRKTGLHNGTVPFEEMKKGALYPVTFSDFQMDPMSGHFMGEIRLAYYYGENGVEILTGGSINGSLLEKADELVFSLEQYKDAAYEGPLAVRIKGVAVAG